MRVAMHVACLRGSFMNAQRGLRAPPQLIRRIFLGACRHRFCVLTTVSPAVASFHDRTESVSAWIMPRYVMGDRSRRETGQPDSTRVRTYVWYEWRNYVYYESRKRFQARAMLVAQLRTDRLLQDSCIRRVDR